MPRISLWWKVWSLVLRNWTNYRQNLWSNISPTLADPAFLLLSLGLGLGAYMADSGPMKMDYAQYIAPGLAASAALFTAFFETSYNFYIRLVYEHVYMAMLTTPMGAREIILGEYLWVALKAAVMSTVVALFVTCLGLVDWPGLIVIPLLGALVGLACGALGLISAAIIKSINQFQLVYTLIVSPMFFFSGIFFPFHGDHIPQWVLVLANLSPLYHGVRLFQIFLWPQASVELAPIAFHGGLLIFSVTVLMALSFRLIRPKLES